MSVEYSLIKKLIKYNSVRCQMRGICTFLNQKEKTLFLSLTRDWEHFSGCDLFPVPLYLGSKVEYLAMQAYLVALNKIGNHNYGIARRALIKFVVEELEPKLNSWEQFKLKVYKKWRNYE
jgi:hypothetical protein